MFKQKTFLATTVLCGALSFGYLTASHVRAADPAPTTQKAVDPTPVNKMCAVETDQPIDPSFTLVYDGKTYGFCCKDCMAKFKADPEKYAANAK
jgi:YHS domain-containing protein